MKKLHVFTLAAMLIVMVSASVWANPVTPEQAKRVASDFLSGKTMVDPSTGRRMPRRAPAQSEIETKVVFDATDSHGQPLMYAVNFNRQGGYVLVSGDDQFNEVLGYNDAENFNEQDMPENMRAWLQGYIDEMNQLKALHYQPSLRRSPAARAAVAPMVTTKWGQRTPFNNLCPIDTDGRRSITGCVATAFAQILNYHIQHYTTPAALIAELPGYTTGSHGLEVSAIPAGSPMPDKSLLLDEYNDQATDAQKEAVARLMLYCGTAVHMDYTSSSSGTATEWIPEVLINNFGYANTAKNVYRVNYSNAAWHDLIYGELAAGRPMEFAGGIEDGGHAFVLDGFDGFNMFHINWGWSGHADGYFALSVMNPDDEGQPGASSSGAGYSAGQRAVIGIQVSGSESPAPAEVCMSLVNLRVNGQQVQVAAINWTGEVHSFDYGIGFVETSGEITPIEYSSVNDFCINCYWGDVSYTIPTNTDYALMTRKIIPISREQGSVTWCGPGKDDIYWLAAYDGDGVPHLTVHPIVDLQVSNLTVPSDKYVNDKHTISLTLTNHGDEYFGSLFLYVSQDETIGTRKSEACITALPGSTQDMRLFWTPTATGTYTLRVTLDREGTNVLGTTTATVQSDPALIGKTLVVSSIDYEGLDESTWQTDGSTGVRTVDIYADELSGGINVKNVSEETLSDIRLKIQFDRYNPATGAFDKETVSWDYSATFNLGTDMGYSANRNDLIPGNTYRIRLSRCDVEPAVDMDEHIIIRLWPVESRYTSILSEGLPDPAYWSITPSATQAGTTIDLTYVGLNKVQSVVLQSSIPYEYTGGIQTFTAPETGVYELHAWGAQGGTFKRDNDTNQGGLGGYATCRTNLTAGETIYIYVGGQGSESIHEGGAGGWNGGGHGGIGYSSNMGSAGGGGATHISKVNNQVIGSGSGQCASLAGTDFILVAGGGGGASHPGSAAGVGGGTEGGLGTNCSNIHYTDAWYWDPQSSYGKVGGTSINFFSWGAEGSGGGGGGFYGGNAHADHTANMDDSGGCGGNSAYNSSLATNFITTAGQRKGNGRVKIRLVSSAAPQASSQEVTKTSDNHWRYTMPAEDVFVQVTYVTEYASVTTAPTAISGLIYNGEAQAIINAGEAEGGTLYYSLDDYNWSTTVPVAISGQHTVYYKVVADADHLDYIPSPNTINVSITDFVGAGTADDPYLIPSELAWNLFASKVNSGSDLYAGKYFRQTADISVTTMAGTSSQPFNGIYDGDGHTLAVAYNTTEECTAPFRYINGATIKNLRTAGTITTSAKFAGSIVGEAKCNNSLINCRASVFITSTIEGDGTHGGIIGLMQGDNNNNTITMIEGCVFDGKLLGDATYCCGGFVGWCPSGQQVRLELANNLYAPQEVTFKAWYCQTFSRGGDMNLITITNCYYSQTLGDAQGKQMYSITGEDGVSVANAGAATEYSVSGITSYGTGISYGGVLYAGNGETVSLNLSGSTNYMASAGTLAGSSNPRILTMAAANTVIYGDATVTAAPSAKNLTYNGVEQALVNAGTASGGTMNYSLDNSSWSTSIPTATDADDYTVYYKVVGDANHSDYTPSPNTVAVTISKAALSITADNKSVTYGDAAPTYTASYSGFVGSETASVLGGSLAYACEYSAGSNVGGYTITPNGVTASNYDITFNAGTLTVNKADAVITTAPTAVEGLVYTGAAQTLISAGSATGGELQYSLDNSNWSTNLPTGTDASDYTVYYKVVGDANHTDIDAASFPVTISGPADQVLTANQDPNRTSDYYSTFYHSAIQYTLPEGTQAYIATLDGDALNLTKIAEAGQVLPADNAVILKASGSSITLTPSDAAPVTFDATNNLLGVDAATAAPSNCYVLSGRSSDNSVTGVGFYQFTGTLAAHKAYVVIGGGGSMAPKRLRFVFNNENTATGVENVQSDNVQSTKVLRNGQLIIIRGDKEYNAQGQIVK